MECHPDTLEEMEIPHDDTAREHSQARKGSRRISMKENEYQISQGMIVLELDRECRGGASSETTLYSNGTK